MVVSLEVKMEVIRMVEAGQDHKAVASSVGVSRPTVRTIVQKTDSIKELWTIKTTLLERDGIKADVQNTNTSQENKKLNRKRKADNFKISGKQSTRKAVTLPNEERLQKKNKKETESLQEEKRIIPKRKASTQRSKKKSVSYGMKEKRGKVSDYSHVDSDGNSSDDSWVPGTCYKKKEKNSKPQPVASAKFCEYEKTIQQNLSERKNFLKSLKNILSDTYDL